MKWVPGTAALVISLTALSAGAERLKPSGGGGTWDKAMEAAKKRAPAADKEEPAAVEQDLRVQVDASFKGLKGTADFLVENAVQANHVAGGERNAKVRTAQGESSAQKKWGFIVNLLPVVNPNRTDVVMVQMQVELSGPGEAPDEETSTWQLQTEFQVKKGVKRVIASAGGRLEVTVSDAPLPGPNLGETPR